MDLLRTSRTTFSKLGMRVGFNSTMYWQFLQSAARYTILTVMVSVTLEVADEGGASVGGNKEAEADAEKNLLDPEPNKKAKTGPGQVELLHFMGVTVGHDSLDTRH
eukprot:scaffold7098_cov164-Amphora_coffeaeformis.AAC.1